MGRCRFVQPETVRLPLSDGDWLEVKKQLTVGEERASFQKMVGEVNDSGWRRPNVEMAGLAQIHCYIVEWSFRDKNDKPVPVSLEAIRSLDTATYDEIDKAIEAHITAVEAEQAEAKKKMAGESKSEATSSSAG